MLRTYEQLMNSSRLFIPERDTSTLFGSYLVRLWFERIIENKPKMKGATLVCEVIRPANHTNYFISLPQIEV